MSNDTVRTLTLRYTSSKFEFLEKRKEEIGAQSWESFVLKLAGYPGA